MSLRDKDINYATKQEESGVPTNPSSSTSRQWLGLKNPRIVPVSRTFGGKDRHSKVCTIKGLRDRRIRLSVPTAIQLYDLQDRLGLNQPSKVIDWLLDSTKNDIDKLPPLPIIPGSFNSFHQHALSTSQGYEDHPQSNSNSLFLDANLLSLRKEVDDVHEEDQSFVAKLKHWGSDVEMRSKQKGVDQGTIVEDGNTSSHVCAQNLFPIVRSNSSVLPNSTLLNNNLFNYYQWEPSNLSLTHQLGNNDLSNSPNNHHQQINSTRLPPSGSHEQLSLYPSMTTTPFVHTHASFMNTRHHQQQVVDDHNDLRQLNHFDYSNPISSPIHSSATFGSKSFPWSMNHHHHLDKDTHDN